MDDRSVRLRIRWLGSSPAEGNGIELNLREHGLGSITGDSTEFGLQKGRWDVSSGTAQHDGTVVFETTVQPYQDKTNRQRFRGDHIQGPPDEPFLYLSWRVAGAQQWIMRGKVSLVPLTPELLASLPDGATLETEVSRLGHRDAGHVQEWRLV